MLMLGIRSGSILKQILPATADGYCTFVEIAVGFTRVFQHLFDLVPVFAGVLIHYLPWPRYFFLPWLAFEC